MRAEVPVYDRRPRWGHGRLLRAEPPPVRLSAAGEYLGLCPACTLGTTADRNHVVTRDFRGLR